jgi:hypothetical protein
VEEAMTSTTILRTLCGLYLHTGRSAGLADGDRDRLIDELESAGWVDVHKIVKSAFDIAVARIDRPDSDVRSIRELIAGKWLSCS